MLKFGLISEIDLTKGLARVNFAEDDMVSGWLKIGVMRSLNDQFTFPFAINEHVYCLMDENCEYGVICGAVYDEKNKPDGATAGVLKIKFGQNSVISFNGNSGILNVDIAGDATIKCAKANIESTGKTTVKATNIDLEATEVAVKGILSVTGVAKIQGVVSMGGMASITPGTPLSAESGTTIQVDTLEATNVNATDVSATGDVTAGVISLKTHKHLAPSGGGTTGPATP